MKKFGKVLLWVVGILAAVAVIVWVVGWTAPINKYIPFIVTLNRPELRAYKDDLFKGNEWAKVCSPLTTQLGMPADGGDCANGLQALSDQAKQGYQVFYQVYSEEEIAADPSLAYVGFYVLRAENTEKRPFVAMVAGGAFRAVCTMWESLPTAAAFQAKGYTSFCLRYRTSSEIGAKPTEEQLTADTAACLSYIVNHADEFNILTENYLLGGFSAGARVVNMWANEEIGYAAHNLPAPGAVCLMYAFVKEQVNEDYHMPTFCRYSLNDEYYPDYSVFEELEETLTAMDLPHNFNAVQAKHGFGLGSNTDAEGWDDEAEAFWLAQINQ